MSRKIGSKPSFIKYEVPKPSARAEGGAKKAKLKPSGKRKGRGPVDGFEPPRSKELPKNRTMAFPEDGGRVGVGPRELPPSQTMAFPEEGGRVGVGPREMPPSQTMAFPEEGGA